MQFSQRQIDMAIEFKRLGLEWEPAVGHYVFDVNGFVGPSSPFQPGVYFVLNYDCFMQRVGGVEKFKEQMVWLPTWEHARDIARQLGVDDSTVEQRLVSNDSVANRSELSEIYDMIHEQLLERSPSVANDARCDAVKNV